jgi:hypothetical protein
MYSQFFRMYTSKSIGTLTLILASQVRMDLGAFMPKAKATGGNAIKHYNILDLELEKAGNATWPGGKENIPPNSFPVRVKIAKAKMMNRYIGNSIIIYFYKGSFEHKFNVLAIAKDLGLHDGKKISYTVTKEDGTEEVKEFSSRGFYDAYNRIPDEVITYLESKIPAAYTKSIMLDNNKE